MWRNSRTVRTQLYLQLYYSVSFKNNNLSQYELLSSIHIVCIVVPGKDFITVFKIGLKSYREKFRPGLKHVNVIRGIVYLRGQTR